MNLGSKFNKVKQQASIFLRGDKTDVIGSLRDAEDRSDELRVLSDAISRSLEKRLYTYNVPDEKKMSKVPENQVAELMREGLKEVISCQSSDQMEKSLFRCVVEEAVTVEKLLGNIFLEYEQKVGREVLPFLHNLLKDDFPSLSKEKKALKQAGQDLDAAKARLRNSQASSPAQAKIDSQHYIVDEAEAKLEQIKDNYACDLLTTVSHQREIARLTCLQMEIKLEYLQRSVITLNALLPPIQKLLKESPCGPVYCVPLHEHLRITQRKIALPIEACIKRLIEVGLKEEGLFRVAGSSTKIKRLRCEFDAGILSTDSLSAGNYDVHVIAGALKSYLRELPEPLLTHVRHDQWIQASGKSEHDDRLRALWQVTTSLPEQNHINLVYIMKFLSMLANNSSHNKMTASNIAIVIAPNLIWTQRDCQDVELATLGRDMSLTNDYRIVVEQMIEYSSYFFKEDIDFGVEPICVENINDCNKQTDSVTHNLNVIHVQNHKRNNSTELGFLAGHEETELDSPKQPHRNKKKPAPKPPALKKIDFHSADSTTERSTGRRSQSPPVTSTLSGKLHQVRRPTEEPPLPPTQSGTKPPRPQPPSNYENIGGGEDGRRSCDQIYNLVEVNNHREAIDEDNPNMYVSLRESSAASSEFKKSLEGILQHPQPFPRHLSRMSTSYPEQDSIVGPNKFGLPVAAQRSFRKAQTDRPDAVEKPIIAEKPNLLQRPAVGVENSRPLVPDKPLSLFGKPQTKGTSDEEAVASGKNKVIADDTHL